MNTFFRLLFLLPGWYNFSSPITVILVPGEIQNDESRRFWDAKANGQAGAESGWIRAGRVRQSLISFYTSRRMKFAVYADSVGVPIEEGADTFYVDILGRMVEYQSKEAGDQLLLMPPRGKARTAGAARIQTSSPKSSPDRQPRINPNGKPNVAKRINPLGKQIVAKRINPFGNR